MAYLGNVPARSFISFERQVFTIVNSQTAYTLSHSVTNENDIRLVINNVVQEPGSGKAYTASGTTLTLSAALVNGTDEMYCVFLGRAVGTVNAPAGSVTSSTLASDINISTTGTVTTAGLITDSITKTGNLTVDVSGNIRLDAADNGEVRLLDGGTQYGVLKDDSQRLKIQGTVSDKDILFAVNDGGSETTALTLDASEAGLAIFNAGIAIGGTGSANTLDDYEEGTFTPTWASNVSVSVSSGNYGYYTKIGNMVTVYFGAVLTCSTTSYYQITNAPFQSNIASGNAMGAAREYGHTGNMHATMMADNSTTITIKQYNNIAIANAYLHCTLTYRTD